MQRLIRDVGVLKRRLAVCTRCGICQGVCPLYAQTRKESDVSRGKLTLISGLMDGLFEDAKGVDDRLRRCLLCGACTKNCPSNVSTLEIFLLARSIIARYLGLPLGEKLLFQKLLAHPSRFDRLTDLASRFQPVLFDTDDNLQATSCARIMSPILKGRHVKGLSLDAFHKTLKGKDLILPGKGPRVAFFVGCLVDKMFPDIARDVVAVMAHVDAHLIVPAGQGCCGIPALAAGDTDTFKTLVRTHAELFEKHDFDYLVTACATCTSTIVRWWPALAGQEDARLARRVADIAQRTKDISWLLARQFDLALPLNGQKSDKQTEKQKSPVTYHDPCHLKKSLDVHHEPRQVIQAAGHPLVEMNKSDQCCGMGGSFGLKHEDLSARIGMEKAGNIMDKACPVVATSCPACMMQISDMLARKGASVSVRHPIQLYARALQDNTLME